MRKLALRTDKTQATSNVAPQLHDEHQFRQRESTADTTEAETAADLPDLVDTASDDTPTP